jgi:hypothetical protein
MLGPCPVQLQYLFNTPLITTYIPTVEVYKINFDSSKKNAMVLFINPFQLKFIYTMLKKSVPTSENSLHLHYKDQSVTAV